MSSFEASLPSVGSGFSITQPGAASSDAYVLASLTLNGTLHSGIKAWCVDYAQDISSGYSYPAPAVYSYTSVVADPALALFVAQPLRLNQLAWLLNNVDDDTTVAIGPQSYGGSQYSGCGALSWSDQQAAFWALVSAKGACDNMTSLCTNTLNATAINQCNVAWLWNTAFAAVPDGSNYSVPAAACGARQPIVPVAVVPTGESYQVAQGAWSNANFAEFCLSLRCSQTAQSF